MTVNDFIDPDAVLANPVALESLQVQAGGF